MQDFEFSEKLNRLLKEHNITIEEDCDYWELMNGYFLFKGDAKDSFAHVTGVSYKRDGSGLEGDLEGVLELITEAINRQCQAEKPENQD